jgi:hypothetical protein
VAAAEQPGRRPTPLLVEDGVQRAAHRVPDRAGADSSYLSRSKPARKDRPPCANSAEQHSGEGPGLELEDSPADPASRATLSSLDIARDGEMKRNAGLQRSARKLLNALQARERS